MRPMGPPAKEPYPAFSELIAKLKAANRCPACKHVFESLDIDPFCSSCVEAGWAEAYLRGYADAQKAAAP